MIAGLILGTLIVVAAMGGEAVLVALGTAPVLGGFASWYAGLVGPLQPGILANLIYGAMAAQVVIIPMALAWYGPDVLAAAWMRSAKRRQPQAK